MNEVVIKKAAVLLEKGDLVSFPTETVYGLGADATNDKAVKKIYEAKGRPSNNPLIAHVTDVATIIRYAEIPSEHTKTFQTLTKKFCPGPLTFVLKKNMDSSVSPPLSKLISAGTENVSFRIPSHPIALELLKTFGKPIAAPSANPSNYISPTTAEHVRAGLGDSVALIIDGGPCTIGVESTVISLLPGEKPTLLRPGGVSLEALDSVAGVAFTIAQSTSSPEKPLLSPGQLATHYSPHTKLRFRNAAGDPKTFPPNTGLIEFFPSKHEFNFKITRTLSKNGNLLEVAHELFDTLRALDSMNLDLIIVDQCGVEGIGRAIMDRLNRAVH